MSMKSLYNVPKIGRGNGRRHAVAQINDKQGHSGIYVLERVICGYKNQYRQ